MTHVFTASEILDAFAKHGSDVSYCPDCGEFNDTDSRNCNTECMGEDCIRYEDLRYELEMAFGRETEAMGSFIHRIAVALGVNKEWGGGYSEQWIIEAIEDLKRRAK